MNQVKMLSAGEQGLVVEFGTIIDAKINLKVHYLSKELSRLKNQGVLEVVPTYRSLLVYFNPLKLSRVELERIITGLLNTEMQDVSDVKQGQVIHIPVCYGGEFGPDLDFVAEFHKISVEEVIKIHTSKPYLVYMLGFTPGFPYLGGMSEEIATPRLEKPRTVIPAGSVGIAGSQTGFYPIESPGGWRLIGRTPVKAFNPASSTPFLFAAGDYLKFEAISTEEYDEISVLAAKGSYQPQVTPYQKEGDN